MLMMDGPSTPARLSLAEIRDEVVASKRKKAAATRKRKTVSMNVADAETQLTRNRLANRVQGGENAVKDLYRKPDWIAVSSLGPAIPSMASELQQLFQMADDQEGEEVQLPPTPVQQEEGPLYGVDNDDDYGGFAPMDMDEGAAAAPEAAAASAEGAGDVEQPPAPQPEDHEAPFPNTQKSRQFKQFLDAKFEQSSQLSLNTLTQGKSRLVVAGCFFELLQFKSHDLVNLVQDVPYGDVLIEKIVSTN